MIREFIKEIKGINFIDIGSSGSLDSKWAKLESDINMIGFDPNADECLRMSQLPNNYRSRKYLPFAVGSNEGIHTLYKTKSIYCYSLLEPDSKWLNRFSFGDLFEKMSEELINTTRLDNIQLLKDLDVDVIKIDTQGMELPILQNGQKILDNAFFVETETGFVKNYIGETTYSEIDFFMTSKGFLLFDVNMHRVARNNLYKNISTNSEQLMWCEATWLKDYVSLIEQNRIDTKQINREKALKILVICGLQGCLDYGYELAILFNQLQVIDSKELKSLEEKNAWNITEEPIPPTNIIEHKRLNLITAFLRLIPFTYRKEISRQAQLAASRKHLFRR